MQKSTKIHNDFKKLVKQGQTMANQANDRPKTQPKQRKPVLYNGRPVQRFQQRSDSEDAGSSESHEEDNSDKENAKESVLDEDDDQYIRKLYENIRLRKDNLTKAYNGKPRPNIIKNTNNNA